MRNRFQEMQDCIMDLASIYKENEGKEFSQDDLYTLAYNRLVNIGVKNPGADFSPVFKNLQTYFSNRRNIETYIDPKNGYFLELRNKPELHMGKMETLKIYIPQDKDNIERSARVLFDFLENSNISHISKISKEERNDDIVIQVTNINDVRKILDFARGNKQIQNGLIPANPFNFNVDEIALSTSKNNSSINSVVASLLAVYSKNKIDNKDLDGMFLLDFVDFSQKYYEHHFEKLNDLGEVVSDFHIKGGENNTNENNRKIANIGNLTRFFLDSIYPNYSYNDYTTCYLENANDGKTIEKVNAIAAKRIEKISPIGSQFVGSIDGILLESVDTFKNKYHIDDARALNIVDTYLKDGNISKITRENDIRNKYIKTDFGNKMTKLLSLSGSDLASYYAEKKTIRSINAIQDAIMETYQKYEDRYEQGFEQADGVTRSIYALKRMILTGDTSGFTRDNNARENLIKFGDSRVLLAELSKNGEITNLHDGPELNMICGKYVQEVINSRKGEKEKEAVAK